MQQALNLESYKSISSKNKKKRFTMRKPNLTEAITQFTQLSHSFRHEGSPHYSAFCSLAVARCEQAMHSDSSQEAGHYYDAGTIYWEAASQCETKNYTGVDDDITEAINSYLLAIKIYVGHQRYGIAGQLYSEMGHYLSKMGNHALAAEFTAQSAHLRQRDSPMTAARLWYDTANYRIAAIDYKSASECLNYCIKILNTVSRAPSQPASVPLTPQIPQSKSPQALAINLTPIQSAVPPGEQSVSITAHSQILLEARITLILLYVLQDMFLSAKDTIGKLVIDDGTGESSDDVVSLLQMLVFVIRSHQREMVDSTTKEEIAAISKRVCDAFTSQYVRAYIAELVNHCKQTSDSNKYLLQERPRWTSDLKKGWIFKEGVVNTSWKKRWFVIHSNYLVDYFENETEVEKPKGKKKGTMNLAGYTVVEDPNLSSLARLKRLAEKMDWVSGVDFRTLPKPKEYPPLVLELHHPRRRCYYLKANSYDEFVDWCAHFKSVCWNIEGLTLQDECHQAAFPLAVRNTRWALGRWGGFSYGGSEEQVLSDLIADEVDAEVMGRVYSKMSGPWFVRNTLRGQAQKTIDASLALAVRPAWTGVAKTISMMRPKLEPTAMQLISSILDLENKFSGSMRENAMTILNPIIQEHIIPYLGKIINMLRVPLDNALEECINLFTDKVESWRPLEDMKESFVELDYLARSHYYMRPATSILNALYEPLWALNLTFEDISPWNIIFKAHSLIRKLTDNAVWTWEQDLVRHASERRGEENVILWNKSLVNYARQAREGILDKFKRDAQVASAKFIREAVMSILLPPLQAILVPMSSKMLVPVEGMVPESLAEFIDVKQMFENFYISLIESSIETVMPNPQISTHSEHAKTNPSLHSQKPLPSPRLSSMQTRESISPQPPQKKSLPVPPQDRKPLPTPPQDKKIDPILAEEFSDALNDNY